MTMTFFLAITFVALFFISLELYIARKRDIAHLKLWQDCKECQRNACWAGDKHPFFNAKLCMKHDVNGFEDDYEASGGVDSVFPYLKYTHFLLLGAAFLPGIQGLVCIVGFLLLLFRLRGVLGRTRAGRFVVKAPSPKE